MAQTDPVVLVQNNPRVADVTGPLAAHARRRGWRLVDLDLREGFAFPEVDLSGGLVLLGSVGFLRVASATPALAPLLHWAEDAFRADLWASAFGPDHLGHGGCSTDAAGVARMARELGRVAVRPLVGLKAFRGGVHDEASWAAMRVAADVPCHAVAPTELLSEHRVWFVAGRAVAASRYRDGGRPARDGVGAHGAMAEATRMAAGRLPLDTVVVDVASTAEGWRIVELNCVHSSGWYGGDVGVVADALHAAAAAARGATAPPPAVGSASSG